MKSYGIVVHLMFACIFLVGWTEMSLVGLLPVVANDMNLTAGDIAGVVTAYSLAFAIGAPILVFSLRRVNRRLALTALMATIAIANLWTGLGGGWLDLFISRIIIATAAGAFAGTALATVSIITKEGNVGRVLGYVLVGFGASLAFGIPLSVYLSEFQNWQRLYIFLACLAAFLSILLFALVPQDISYTESSSSPTGHGRPSGIERPAILAQFLTLLWMSGYAVVFTFFSARLTEVEEYNLSFVSVSLLTFGVATLVGAKVGGELVDRVGPRHAVALSFAVHAVVLVAGTVLLSSKVGTLFFVLIWGIASWSSTPGLQYFVAENSGDHRDLMLTLNNSLLHLGIAIGATVGALVYFDARLLFFGVSAVPLAFAATIALISLSPKSA